VRFAVALDEEHHLACRSERVLPAAHRHRSGVAGEPRDTHAYPRGAGDRGDDAHRQVLVQQHGALLDMRFDIRNDVSAAPVERAPTIGIAAEVDQRLSHRDPTVVGLIEPRRIERSGHRPATDQRGAETHTFFVAEADDLKRVR
jgi:hypothetical protein